MTNAYIKSIHIKNFKGIASYSAEFDSLINEITAENGSCKSSIKYAWQWVLCQNVPDVLPMLNNKEIPDLVTSVEVVMNINNIDYTFRRESKGKYRLNENNQMCKTTNENTYSIDGILLKESDYKTKIANLLNDGTFDNLILLTDKDVFNSDTTKWKWSDRRKFLFRICNVDNAVSEILNKPKYDDIRVLIQKGNATSDIKSMLTKEKKGYKETQTKNAILIEQKNNEIAEYSKIDFESLNNQIEKLNKELDKINSSSQAELQSEKLQQLQAELLSKTEELSNLQSADTVKLSSLKGLANKLYNECQTIYSNYSHILADKKIAQERFDELALFVVETTCPICKQPLPEDTIAIAQQTHDKELEELGEQIKEYDKQLNSIKSEYDKKKHQYSTTKEEVDHFAVNPQIKTLEDAIIQTKQALEAEKASSSTNSSIEKQTAIKNKIRALSSEYAKLEFINGGKEAIKGWQAESRDCADKIMVVEKKEIALADFVREQTDIINNTVNDKFKNGISWSLYNETYKDGQGGIEEDCVCMYNGKRYSSMSTGEKAVADLEVVKVLQDYFDASLPIWVDDSESITINYNLDNRQVIKLKAQSGAKIDNLVKIEDLYKEIK